MNDIGFDNAKKKKTERKIYCTDIHPLNKRQPLDLEE
jgi:hypothetical protein